MTLPLDPAVIPPIVMVPVLTELEPPLPPLKLQCQVVVQPATVKDDKGNTTTKYGEWSDWNESGPRTTYSSASSKNLGSASDTLVFYTKPAEFSWGSGVATDKTI